MKEFKKKWFSSENWKLSIVLIIIGFLSIYTLSITYSYFNRNEIFWGISDKYVTTKNDSIKDIIDTTLIYNEFNQNEKEKNIIKIHDSTRIHLSNSYPVKHRIEKTEIENFELGDIGDFIGGYFGFLIGVIGALLTFLAFYIQYKANKDVQKQFRFQQFETQFHKMIDVYLNNKDKFSIIGYKNPKNKTVNISGNLLIEKLNFENKEILECRNNFKKIDFIEYITRDHVVFQKFLVELKVVYRVFLEAYKEKNTKTESQLSVEIKTAIFIEAYKLFFNGLNKYEKTDSYEDYVNLAIEALKKIRNKHRKDGSKKFENFYKDINDINKTLWVKLNYEPFKGYLHFLPQYYRNLYSIVNYVVNQNEDLSLPKAKKLEYLKLLRSTMSEYEFTLLFYNWFSGVATEWEDDKNKFFSEYKMLKNINDLTYIDSDLICTFNK